VSTEFRVNLVERTLKSVFNIDIYFFFFFKCVSGLADFRDF
jgi:hypothetical protein